MKSAFLIILLAPSFLAAQTAQSDPVKIYTSGPGVTAPELLPHQMSDPYVSDHCTGDQQGKISFSLIVDAGGTPRNIFFLQPLGNDLDVLALRHVAEDRFKPGTLNGQPVAVAGSLDVSMRTCLRDEKDAHSQKRMVLHLAAEPEQELKPPIDPPQQVVLVSGNGVTPNPEEPNPLVYKVGGDVKAPHTFPPSADAMAFARGLLDLGDYKVSVLVDRNGMPESIRILDTAQPGREQQVAGIMRTWRFKPAMLNGQPVPARVEISLRFTAHGR
ncbi:MAG TPA: energy transducer TonB [Terracidiphilus sp.]|nr:energy transducer TonB [Terracidiphilus sp.]